MKAKNWAVIIASVVLAVWFIFAFMPVAVPVEVATIDRGDVVVTVQDDGKTRVKDLYVVYAPVTGHLQRIEMEVGDAVQAGATVLATMSASTSALLDSRSSESAEAAVRAAQAALDFAESESERLRAELAFAKSDIERIEPLFKNGTVSQATMDRAKLLHEQTLSGLKSSQSTVDIRSAELRRARALLSPRSDEKHQNNVPILMVKSPVSGAVLAVHHESAGVVSAGTALISVGNASDIEIVADFLSTSAVKVKSGARVSVEGWGGEPLLGTVRLVEPTGFLKVSALGIEEQRVNIIIDFNDSTSAFSKLGHGFKVEPKIVVNNHEGVIRVPISSLFRSNGGWAVFTVVDGEARFTYVEVGPSNVDYAVVIGGLNQGDVIIQHPSDALEDGSSVKLK